MRSRPASPRRLLAVLAASLALLVSVATARSAQDAAPAGKKSVKDGVYLAEQADRAADIFKSQCSSCHQPGGWTNAVFFDVWAGRPLSDLFVMMRTTMPEDNPGALPAQQYADLVAYILSLNKFPAGSEELKASEETLKTIILEKTPQ